MCGISGWFANTSVAWRPEVQTILDLVTGIENRGRDATGYGTLAGDRELYVYKGPVGAWKWKQEFAKLTHPIGAAGLLHCRAANVGSPDNNENNHPLAFESDRFGVMITHNGTIGNLEAAYEKLGTPRVADVDSALIAAALGTLGPLEGMDFLVKYSGGSGAFAALYDDGRLLLARDCSPLYIAKPQGGVLLWSSEIEPLRKMSNTVDSEFGLPFFKIYQVPDAQYYLWTRDGRLESQGKFRLPAMVHPPSYFRDRTAATAHQTHHPVVDPASADAPAKKEEAITQANPTIPSPGVVLGTNIHLGSDPADLATRKDPTRCITMEKVHKVTCNWGGCWKKSIFRVYWNCERWIPLCEHHKNKWQKKGQSIIVSGTHEMARKMVAVIQPEIITPSQALAEVAEAQIILE